jgi:hypothetical protein
MSWLSSFFKPKQDNFMKYLTRQAELDVVGLEGLTDYMKKPTKENADRVNQAEKDADVPADLVDALGAACSENRT